MKFVCWNKIIKTILIALLIILNQNQLFSQSDSVLYWQTAITNCKTEAEVKTTSEKIKAFLLKRNRQFLINDASILLKSASKSQFSKGLFYDLFSFIENVSNSQKLETEFANFAIKLESNKDFTNKIVQNQLYYYYTLLYYRLKEYYYADKYCTLFLKNETPAFTDGFQGNFVLNAMTILALIDIDKNDLNAALNKLKIVLDSSVAKKNIPWIGITKGNIGDLYYRVGKYNEAILYLNEDIRISLASYEYGSAINSYIDLKEIFTKKNKIDSANLYLDSAYSLFKQIIDPNPVLEDDFLAQGLEVYSSLANRYYQNKDFTRSSEFFAKAFEAQKLKQNIEKSSQIKKIIQRIEIDKNLNKINELHEEIGDKKRVLVYFFAIIIAIIGILIVYIFYYKKLKIANKALIEKNEIIHTQNLELEKTNNDKDRLFSIISHDLRGPARNIQLVFNAVAEKKLPYTSIDSQLPNILKNINNLVNTLESLLSWSASQLKGIKANKTLVDLKEAIELNILFFEDQANKKNLSLINQCPLKIVHIDKNHLEIILRNFTSNAIKFSNEDSSILFKVIDLEDFVEVFVIDEGIGLSESQIKQILNKSAMKSTSGTIGEKGIGLGLLLTKEFIEINGGSLHLKSELNKGTSMSFTIPKQNLDERYS
jgi:signal transduction histidine kinase